MQILFLIPLILTLMINVIIASNPNVTDITTLRMNLEAALKSLGNSSVTVLLSKKSSPIQPATSTVINPVITHPVINPVITHPVITHPVINPVITHPVITHPVITHPVINPVITHPVINPVITHPVINPVTIPVQSPQTIPIQQATILDPSLKLYPLSSSQTPIKPSKEQVDHVMKLMETPKIFEGMNEKVSLVFQKIKTELKAYKDLNSFDLGKLFKNISVQTDNLLIELSKLPLEPSK